MPDTPLNTDGIEAAAKALWQWWNPELSWDENDDRTMGQWRDEMAKGALSAYLTVAQQEVTGEQVNLAGWTCDGIHERGSYATCEDCRGACDDLANFYNNMMQQPTANRSWTGRPEANDA
ncbi:hypothetical protein [Glutamicibacter mysorens]|uniref:hypothetical protein n=1 Tax=Glutamicibacter mysorens TaxID=257984 RepID=UPI0020C65C45|nr:hypothetical protein [Glutamicibacter mysorens]UTM47241.1 hypothetical protein XH9_17220 [Glutamicibacter mysorens]